MEISETIIKYLSNNCTGEECEELLKWVEASEENKKLFADLKNTYTITGIASSENQDIDINQSFTTLKHKISERPRRSLSNAWKIAASVLITVGLTTFLTYFIWNTPAEIAIHQLSVPSGQQAQLTLSDGTKIWLNSKSKLTYPGTFEGNKREVTLEGEGYFQVSHNPKKPFIVKTSHLDIKVLGTSFNVTSYNDEENISLALETGSVSISEKGSTTIAAKLKPNDLAIYSKTKKELALAIADTDVYKSWLKGQFKFRNLSFEDISKRLGRNFNVNFIFESEEIKQIKYNGSFYNYEPLNQILKIMQTNSAFRYKIDKDKVFIK